MSVKNTAGATFFRHVSACERIVKTIDDRRRSERRGDCCVYCGATDVLWMSDEGYVCDEHRKTDKPSYYVNSDGRCWTF